MSARARLHRVVIVVADLDAAIERYTRLLGASFTRTRDAVAAATGVAAAADPDIGIELACPLAGHPSPIAADLAGWLAERGEGIYGMALNCPDTFDQALAGARAEGLSFAMEPVSFSQEEIDLEFGGRYSQYREAIVDRRHLGYALAYNAIVDKG